MAIPKVSVEILEGKHLAEISALFVRVFNSAPWNDGWSSEAAHERLDRMLNHPDQTGVVSIDGESVVGFALGYTERWIHDDHFHLKEMCVDPKLQRSGIGSTMLSSLAQQLKGRGIRAIYLETQGNSTASRFYEKQGFKSLALRSYLKRLT